MGYQILITDDEDVLRYSCAEFLRLNGYDVVEFASGIDLLYYLEQGGEQADLLLLDVAMPHMSGFEVLERLSLLPVSLPVVLLSGYPETDIEADISYRPFIYLRKPVFVPTLLAKIEKLLATKVD